MYLLIKLIANVNSTLNLSPLQYTEVKYKLLDNLYLTSALKRTQIQSRKSTVATNFVGKYIPTVCDLYFTTL